MDALIPGQSLTKPPRNYPWERPYEIVDPEEAVQYHLERLSRPDTIDNVLFALEMGVPVKHMTKGLMTAATGNGIHNVDVGLIIYPVVAEFIRTAATEADVSFINDFENAETKKQDEDAKVMALLKKSLEETPEEQQDSGFEMIKDITEAPQEMPEEPSEEQPVMEDKPRGLMSRV